jgi:diaminopimelate decarboxylase
MTRITTSSRWPSPRRGLRSAASTSSGPVCETGDIFARDRDLPEIRAGDLVAFRSAGAYGAVMASEYNSRPLVPEVMVKNDHFAVIRRRPTFDEIIARDTIPPWL